MPLVNPYGEVEFSNEFPLMLAIIFMLGIVFLALAMFILYHRNRPESRYRRRIPEWAINAAYPALFLLLPFVMLVTVMLFMPDDWAGKAPRKSKEVAVPQKEQPRFLDQDSLKSLKVNDSVPTGDAP